ncbi:hypothetical protein Dda3937_02612 [Dickeya dadantii 3937]|uniref:Uncharacterized protein n=1 Tax=Dickeya dadantii (strain 3937) TaxID=198628 RepID=E0SEE4_DICD3|nr:hypothetical protein Dda3937_02612 [Dickeya dadantii 3937]
MPCCYPVWDRRYFFRPASFCSTAAHHSTELRDGQDAAGSRLSTACCQTSEPTSTSPSSPRVFTCISTQTFHSGLRHGYSEAAATPLAPVVSSNRAMAAIFVFILILSISLGH